MKSVLSEIEKAKIELDVQDLRDIDYEDKLEVIQTIEMIVNRIGFDYC